MSEIHQVVTKSDSMFVTSLQNNSLMDQEQKDLKDKYSQLLETKVSLDRELIALQNAMAEERNAKERIEMMKADVERKLYYMSYRGPIYTKHDIRDRANIYEA